MHAGCDHPRTRFSVYCEAHHHEQLARVGLVVEASQCKWIRDRCRRVLRAGHEGIITADEVAGNLFDLFVHAGAQDWQWCWSAGLDALTADAIAALRAYARAHPEPRLFHPLPEAAPARQEAERRALAVQGELEQRLDEWLPPGERAGDAASEWYRDRRDDIEAYFVPANVIAGSEKTHVSPSGRYRLVVESYRTKEGAWNYSRGRAYARDRLVADVKRNLDGFHFGWAEGHPDGHDYLLCGEDYQGQTVVQLDTGRRVDHVSEHARSGGAFCPATYYPSPDGRLVVIDGCVWAAPYELVFCQFGEPMSLPWPEIDRVELEGEPRGWTPDGFEYESGEDVRVTDGKTFDDLSGAEQDDLWARWDEIGGRRARRWLRAVDGTRHLLGEKVVPNAKRSGA